MANLQKQFLQFHEAIKLNNLDENAVLREKRDTILEKLRTNLARDFEAVGRRAPTFDTFNLGSYAMGTGVKPLDGDFDIDVALLFNLPHTQAGPVEVKEWVYEALRGHNNRAIRRPCVTVWYQRQGEPIYHVDLPVYSVGAANPDGVTRLAKGFSGSKAEYKVWEPADPKGLVQYVANRFAGADREQFRRVVRALKRWKSVCFPTDGNAAPVGIGLTCAALTWFQPRRRDFLSAEYDDQQALLSLVEATLAAFTPQWSGTGLVQRLSVRIPVVPYDNPFERMSDVQMEKFQRKLTALRDALGEANRLADPVKAAGCLVPHFGEHFPVPDPAETAQKRGPSFTSSGESA